MKHRSGHRYRGTLKFSFDDGTVEETKIEVKESKGYDAFMVSVLEAVVQTGINVCEVSGSDMRITYQGDFDKDVDRVLQRMRETSEDPEKAKKVKELMKQYKEADEIKWKTAELHREINVLKEKREKIIKSFERGDEK